MSSSYSSKLRDARWQRKRLEVMERDKWTCRSCGAAGEGVTLNVHHAYYESGKDPWEYPSSTLVTWCEECHTKRHFFALEIAKAAAIMPIDSYEGLFDIVAMMGYQEFFATIKGANELDEGSLILCIKAMIRQWQSATLDACESNGGAA